MDKCLYCSKDIIKTRKDVKYCSRTCNVACWKKNNPERAKLIAQRYRDKHRKTRYSYNKEWYQKNKTYKKGYQKRNYLMVKYNMTFEDKHRMYLKQEYKCKICNKVFIEKKLCVDHDHKTGKVRGLLCGKCNIGLGKFKDNIKVLKSAIQYLKTK